MKKDYKFSKGERGKFFRKDRVMNYPIYLDPENLKFIQELADKSKVDMNKIVNDLVKNNIQLAKVLNG